EKPYFTNKFSSLCESALRAPTCAVAEASRRLRSMQASSSQATFNSHQRRWGHRRYSPGRSCAGLRVHVWGHARSIRWADDVFRPTGGVFVGKMTCGEVSLISWSCFVLPAIFAVSLLAGTPAKPAGGVVLITIDTLRADHLGCYGYRNGATPTIDALAVRAAKFEHAYAVAPLTLPSH